ncbi:hypothetical protein FB45DRAFT_1008048 [Roridomyces roridus]|uniref:Uncharacterized protein n=1 Tax=Roridomyces roridus TaxID=1738132 RepID=A0AAD7FD13_9AGAR|nr:hypothetical protein FB45DRAFT_1008048 [Roridomyces roridus]
MHEDGVDGVRTAKGALNGVGRGGMDGGRRRYPPWVNGVVERDEVLPGKDAIDSSNNDQRKEWKMLEGGFAAVVRSVVESGRGAKRRRPGSVITVTPLSQESVLISQAHQYFTTLSIAIKIPVDVPKCRIGSSCAVEAGKGEAIPSRSCSVNRSVKPGVEKEVVTPEDMDGTDGDLAPRNLMCSRNKEQCPLLEGIEAPIIKWELDAQKNPHFR